MQGGMVYLVSGGFNTPITWNGHTQERAAIAAWLETHHAFPATYVFLPQLTLVLNFLIK